MIVLGIHGGVSIRQHDSAAALVVDGKVVALCEEERYLRIKGAYGHLPFNAIQACLDYAGLPFGDIDLVVTTGITYKCFVDIIREFLRHNFGSVPKIEAVHHQLAHLACAFYASSLDASLCVSLDATGDGSCGFLGYATKRDGIRVIRKLETAQSLGFFYTLMTSYLGFTDGDEYKVMGLAPYGRPTVDLSTIIRAETDGWVFDSSFIRADPPLSSPFEPIYARKLETFLGHPSRLPQQPIEQFHRDVAASVQRVMEDCLISLLRYHQARGKGVKSLCYAGGVALNCVANKKILDSGLFETVYVSPFSSDCGLALGCAYLGANSLGEAVEAASQPFLGSAYDGDHIMNELESNGCRYETVSDPARVAAELIAEGKIIGWYQGRSEAGPRALGNRSILARPGGAEVRDRLNARIKYREEFRPFSPAVLEDCASDFFVTNGFKSPAMSFTFEAKEEQAENLAAVIHVDKSARIQTVSRTQQLIFSDLIARFQELSGIPAVLNTSFNLKGQPIVETPRDALMTYFGCGLDDLILGDFHVKK